jgi:sugar lactone lactonase YvrE
LVSLFLATATAFAGKHVFEKSFGAGFLSNPLGVAVDQSNGDVYVTDTNNHRMDKFDSSGAFILTFGTHVNQTKVGTLGATEAEMNVCTAASGDVCQAGEEVLFKTPWGVAVDNDPSSLSNGDVYISDLGTNAVGKFDSSGNFISQITGTPTGGGGAEVPFAGPRDMAVSEATGDLYIVDNGASAIDLFDPSGTYVSRITSPNMSSPNGIAVDGSGNVYVGNPGNNTTIELNSLGECVNSCTPIDGGLSLSVSLEAPSGKKYVDDNTYVAEYGAAGEFLNNFGIGSISNSVAAAVNNATSTVYVTDASLNEVLVFPFVLTELVTGEASNVQVSTATLNGMFNAGGSPTNYAFQYGTTTGYGSSTPVTPIENNVLQPVSANVENLLPNTEYHFRIIGQNGGLQGEDHTFTTLLPKPAIPAESVSNVTHNRAVLAGAIKPENGKTAYFFEYGKTAPAYGASTPVVETPATIAEVPVGPQVLSELTPGTTYHYRLVATNASGTTDGADKEFTTAPPLLPEVSSGAASAVSHTSATIEGSINPNGLATSYTVELGTNTSYGTSLFGSIGTTTEPVRLELQNLAPGTTYHYRLVATNEDGATVGTDVAFATESYPNPIVQPPPPLIVPFTPIPIPQEVTCAKGLVEQGGRCVKPAPTPRKITCKKGFVKKNGKCVKKKVKKKAKGGKKKG